MAIEQGNILIVDDEPAVGRLIQEELRERGFACHATANPCEALEWLRREHFDAVIADIKMPEISGLQLLQNVQTHCPDCRVILITGDPQLEYMAAALQLGAYEYVQKPVALGRIVELLQGIFRKREESSPLCSRAAKAMELLSSSQRVSLDAVRALVRAVEAKDPYTRRHSEQVAHYAISLAKLTGVGSDMLSSIYVASVLHDVGKIGVPDDVLTKPSALTAEEVRIVRQHPLTGAEILGSISALRHEATLVRHHHERWDGQGYPDGLAGEEIPLGSRIIHVADSIDAMLMDRTYKKGYSVERMLEELTRCAGTQFDPALALAAEQWCRRNPEELILPSRRQDRSSVQKTESSEPLAAREPTCKN